MKGRRRLVFLEKMAGDCTHSVQRVFFKSINTAAERCVTPSVGHRVRCPKAACVITVTYEYPDTRGD